MIVIILLAGFILIGSACAADIDVTSIDDIQSSTDNVNEFTNDLIIQTEDNSIINDADGVILSDDNSASCKVDVDSLTYPKVPTLKVTFSDLSSDYKHAEVTISNGTKIIGTFSGDISNNKFTCNLNNLIPHYYKIDQVKCFTDKGTSISFLNCGSFTYSAANPSGVATFKNNSIEYSQNLTIVGNVTGVNEGYTPTGTVTITLNNSNSITINLTKGKFEGNFTNLKPGNYSIKIC